jgi:signal transduction histidine kinase
MSPRERLFRLVTGISITAKIIGMVAGVILALGLGVILQVRTRLQRELSANLETRGVAIARYMATRSTDLLLTDNDFSLYQLIRDTLENNPDVRYALILDAGGNVVVHSFNQSVPPDLLKVNIVSGSQPYQVQTLQSDEGLITDIAVPILEGRAGVVRLGLSHYRLEKSIARATWDLMSVTATVLALGLITAYVLTRILTRPVLDLVGAARAVGQGNLQVKARSYLEDEIGELAVTFNTMTDDLERSHAGLLRRMGELSALSATATAISGKHRLDEMLHTSLSNTLEVMGLPAGWIFLNVENQNLPFRLAAQHGLSTAFASEEATRELADCVYQRVVKNARPLVIKDICTECRRINPAMVVAEGLVSHVSVPLIAGGRVLGVMNVASSNVRVFTFEDMTLLSAVGQQLGVAVENARLWDEVKEKEALLEQFLKKIITVQEAERQRLARELHDQAAQTLTALTLGLRTLQDTSGLGNREARLVEDLKSLTTNLMSELHQLAVELRPSALDRVGLVGAVEQFVRDYGKHFGLEVLFESEKMNDAFLPLEVQTAVYRILQEALTNIARHAQATRVAILLQVRDNCVVATVEDNGHGFDLSLAAKKGRLGLFGMQERAAMLDGVVNIESTADTGTTIYVKIPISAPVKQGMAVDAQN